MSLWSRAADVAAQTPESRNRLVDFLRAASILAVISGHWLMAAPYVGSDGFTFGNMMELASFTTWLSWGFQVMPIFFLVGGYANAVSWRAALRDGRGYASWLDSRLRRLILPVLPLIVLWAVLAPLARVLGVDSDFVRDGSRVALVPIWFLAIYAVIVLLVPLTHAAWQRWGFASFFVAAGLAIADDWLFFAGMKSLGWVNYVFVWTAVHQLGYAWRDDRLAHTGARLAIGCTGLALLYGLTVAGPYPIAMISLPGAEVSNTLPPKVTLLALALAQTGFVLAAEAPLRRWLGNALPWTIAVLLNGMIMTIYLWHSTAMVLMIALAAKLGSVGLHFEPASGGWWLLRPVWLAVYALTLLLLLPLVARFERSASPPLPASAWRQIVGASIACCGLALLAYSGLGGAEAALPMQAIAVLMPLVGSFLAFGLPGSSPRASVAR